MIYLANDKYSAVLTAGYSVGQSTLYVSTVPDNVPTIVVAAKGTDNETVFKVTGKTTNSLTGVSRLRGANVDLDAQTPLTCLNNEEFMNQYVPLFNLLSNGWQDAEETWTYASATTITVPSGAASKYQKGDKIRLKQGGDYKYFYVIGVADTLLTVTGGSDYTVANAAITDNYYSKVENPQGFPDWFSYVPTIVGTSGSAGTYAQDNAYGKFKISGKSCSVQASLRMTNVGSWSGYIRMTVPVATTAHSNAYQIEGRIVAYNSLATKAFARGIISGSGVGFTAQIFHVGYNTWTANDCFFIQGTYQI